MGKHRGFRLVTRRSAGIDPIRRGVAFGLALSLHFVFLILVLYFTGCGSEMRAGHRAIEKPLQLILLARSVSAQAQSATTAVDTAAIRIRRTANQTVARRPATQAPASHMARRAVAPTPLITRLTESSATIINDYADGGFSERLLKTQQGSHAAPQLPGADVPLVSGIELVDRDEQGVGAMVRKTKRLFGIPDRHCIDVDVWKHLTPRELSKRYNLSPSDVTQTSEAHHCNRPMGLSF